VTFSCLDEGGVFIGKEKWNSMMRCEVNKKERVRWGYTCTLYGHMENYHQVMLSGKPWCWWVHKKKEVEDTKKCSQLLELLMGASIHEYDVTRDRSYVCGKGVQYKGSHIVWYG
jgi:hypothetical protein